MVSGANPERRHHAEASEERAAVRQRGVDKAVFAILEDPGRRAIIEGFWRM